MSKKVILMILNQSFLPDPRVCQEYDELVKVGYRVIVIANNSGKDSCGYEIIRLNLHAGISSKYNTFFWKNPKLKREIVRELRLIDVVQVHAVHVHDLFWSFLGVELRDFFGAKLVIDLHENFPAMVRDVAAERWKKSVGEYVEILFKSILNPWNGPIWSLMREAYINPNRLRKYELKILNKCDRFIVVVDEGLERFRSEDFYGKGVVVSNTKDPLVWEYKSPIVFRDKLVVTYVGTVQKLRGLDSAILAMRYLDQAKYELNIVGVVFGSKVHAEFIEMMEKYSIRNVNLVDWLSDEGVAFEYIDRSHVCIVPHKKTELTQSTVPHKLFMYMAKGRPVLVSDVDPLKRIVGSSKNGLVFEAGNSEDLAI